MRRDFLRASAQLSHFLGLPIFSMSAHSSAPAPGRHLLFDDVELPRIRATLARPEFATFWHGARSVDLAADEQFLRSELDLANTIKDLARAGNILARSAFVHKLAPDARHLAVARLALARMLEYRRWDWILEAGRDTVGVMRNGNTAVAAVLAADWLADELTAAEHTALVNFIGNESGPAAERAVFGMTYHDQVVGWTMDPDSVGLTRVDVSRWPRILDLNNLRIIATSGLAAAASFLHGRHPRAAHWAAMARDSMRLFASRLPADGAFPEGPDYWHFTFNYYTVSLELLRRTCDIDLRDSCDFPAMTRYVQTVALATRDVPNGCVNIGDAFMKSGAEPLAWIGRHFRDTTANHLVLQPGTIRELPQSAWAAIWFDPTVPAKRSADIALDRVLFPGIVISRSGWEPTDSVLSFRSGEPENHEHADRNSLLFVAHGERLLTDPLKAAYGRSDPKWLLRLTEAHTALLIDGRGHQYHNGEEGTNASQAAAHLVDRRVGPDWLLAVSDATDAYARTGLPATLVRRTVVFLKPDILLVLDEVHLSTPLPVQTRWQVCNDDAKGAVATTTETFTVTRPHASLRATVGAAGSFTLGTGRLALPESGGIYPYAEAVSAPAREHALLTICTATPQEDTHGLLTLVKEGATWTVSGRHRTRDVRVSFTLHPAALPTVIL